jgi:hypothetical protein
MFGCFEMNFGNIFYNATDAMRVLEKAATYCVLENYVRPEEADGALDFLASDRLARFAARKDLIARFSQSLNISYRRERQSSVRAAYEALKNAM